MSTIAEQYGRFDVPGRVTVEAGLGGMACVTVRNPLAEADIYLQGATVTHFRPKGQRPLLWLSSTSHFADHTPIRGGIPICWPWFGEHLTDKDKPQHGFARRMVWDLLDVAQIPDDRTRVVLRLVSSPESWALFAHDFVLTYTVVVGTSLDAELSVQNSGPDAFVCTEALHTYYRVHDSEQVLLTGLQHASYVDKVKEMRHSVQLDRELRFKEYQNRIYVNAPSMAVLEDPAWGRRVTVNNAGCKDMVVWNPQATRAASMADIGEGEWRGFVCVEAANTGENPVNVAPLTTHTIRTNASCAGLEGNG
ncbi:MAG TPA: D-hexose-6-phosphate mutarotase [Vicinamibacterales bacterium]|jgi:D-hexose-6-phosphate mutarotase